MKKTIKIFAIIASALLCFSCSLADKSYIETEQDKYINNADEAKNVLLGIYRDMTADGMYGYYFSLYFTLPSDEAKVEGSSLANFRNVPSNAYTSTEDEIETGWAKMYSAIFDCNDFIERMEKRLPEFSEADRKVGTAYLAEARALRGLFYFELVRWYGNVPLIKSTLESYNHPSTFRQADPVDVYKYVEADLQYAIDNLPYSTADDVRPAAPFRMSKGAAQGLLAKVYATWAGYPIKDGTKWAKAAEVAGNLVNSGKHALLGNFVDLWHNASNGIWDAKESLIEVSFYSPVITGNAKNDASGRIGKWNGVVAAVNSVRCLKVAGNWKVIPMFGQKWFDRENDPRWALSIADYKYTADGKVPLANVSYADACGSSYDESSSVRKNFCSNLSPAKWDLETYVEEGKELVHTDLSNTNWYILRYADVMLLYAEALNEVNNGPDATAYEMVNMVRRRGYGLDVNTPSATCDLPAGLSYEEFKQKVRDERSYELAFEGHRRQDLTRWGIYCETVLKTYQDYAVWYSDGPIYYPAGEYTIVGKNELLPIPQREVDLCGFVQNPNWK